MRNREPIEGGQHEMCGVRMSPAVARRRRPALCIGKPFPFTTIRLKLQQRSDFKGQELRGKCKYSELEGAEPMPKESGSEAGRAYLEEGGRL